MTTRFLPAIAVVLSLPVALPAQRYEAATVVHLPSVAIRGPSRRCTLERVQWSVAGLLVGAMAGGALAVLTHPDGLSNRGQRDTFNLMIGAGAVVGGVYLWFKPRYAPACRGEFRAPGA